MATIRNKIRTRGDQLYAEAVGRRNGRQCRRMIGRNIIAICIITGILCVVLLVPEFGFIRDSVVLFKDKLKARLSGSTTYIGDELTDDYQEPEASAEGDP
mmetsp:Transcript_9311/g.15475  ORF Transcript_9311/g.15475 Transcript_9311/m.15475 type:complete len:100 (-) Transcript_9311:156-455(-)|eukprot:CAMPEP_0119015146 /NCGR_PEP_ID=MMETSP1176-20130426/10582_1 /TAXON_ID=265551 /ORGANISM="Synedropsis recta cf, Strain CCMP1620" /LENGTH=99 /DNA_ID=CAMNT_0006968415 /DNA_START=122 /DNA_END=421 /DNA_ORIENTATION=-